MKKSYKLSKEQAEHIQKYVREIIYEISREENGKITMDGLCYFKNDSTIIKAPVELTEKIKKAHHKSIESLMNDKNVNTLEISMFGAGLPNVKLSINKDKEKK